MVIFYNDCVSRVTTQQHTQHTRRAGGVKKKKKKITACKNLAF
jgi:hypothetical protein